jgi:hypothetical protein
MSRVFLKKLLLNMRIFFKLILNFKINALKKNPDSQNRDFLMIRY